jgi:hypothetical protein
MWDHSRESGMLDRIKIVIYLKSIKSFMYSRSGQRYKFIFSKNEFKIMGIIIQICRGRNQVFP